MVTTLPKQDDDVAQKADSTLVVAEADLVHLPVSVQRYLRYSGIVGKPRVQTVRLKYAGKFRMAKDKPWMPISVEQFYTTQPPGFLWKAQFKFASVPFMYGLGTVSDQSETLELSTRLGRIWGSRR